MNPHHRGIPDVPEDVDFLMEHLNDPNFDYQSELQSLSDSSTEVFDLERKKVSDTGSIHLSEFDVQSRSESIRYSATSRTESQATAFEYNESVDHVSSYFIFLLTIAPQRVPLP